MRSTLRIIAIAAALILWGCATTAPQAEKAASATEDDSGADGFGEGGLGKGGGGAAKQGAAGGGAPPASSTSGTVSTHRGRVAMASATVTGEVDSNAIKARVREQIGGVRDCYKSALQREPGLAGQVKLEFQIGADGKVTDANSISNDLEDEDLMACIREQLIGWSFPGASGNKIVYKLNLRPE